MKLRTQLLLLAIIVLILPWGGCQYIREMESLLREAQANTAMATAEAAAGLVSLQMETAPSGEEDDPVYVHALTPPMTIDGYASDWAGLPAGYADSSVEITAASNDSHLFLLIQVKDERVVYKRTANATGHDHLLVTLDDGVGQQRQIKIETYAPGWLHGALLSADGSSQQVKQVRGEWLEIGAGYNVELRIPVAWMQRRIGVNVFDVDSEAEPLPRLIGGTGETVPLNIPQRNLATKLAPIAGDRLRLWVLDNNAFVVAATGQLNPVAQTGDAGGYWLSVLYRLLISRAGAEPSTRTTSSHKLTGPEVLIAMNGQPAHYWWRAAEQEQAIVSAAWPVYRGERLIGAVVAEQVANSISLLTNRAMTRLFNLSLLVMAGVTLALLAFATWLSVRIGRLRDAAERAVSADGHIDDTLPLARSGDELGDLSRSYSKLLRDLREYTDYLRTLAAKLSHELRTPLAMLRSSLDNLASEPLSDNARVFTSRAQSGANRLGAILNAMSEATRIEQAVANAEVETFDLREVVLGCADNYRELYSDPQTGRRIESILDEAPCPMTGAPELIAQLLDKLVDNAVDFSPAAGWIGITLNRHSTHTELSVRNEGDSLPEAMRARLFDSMVSLRDSNKESPHLGLGLYIARLIAEFHGGSIRADNIKGGVAFTIRFEAG